MKLIIVLVSAINCLQMRLGLAVIHQIQSELSRLAEPFEWNPQLKQSMAFPFQENALELSNLELDPLTVDLRQIYIDFTNEGTIKLTIPAFEQVALTSDYRFNNWFLLPTGHQMRLIANNIGLEMEFSMTAGSKG